jgi:hypothetical protein
MALPEGFYFVVSVEYEDQEKDYFKMWNGTSFEQELSTPYSTWAEAREEWKRVRLINKETEFLSVGEPTERFHIYDEKEMTYMMNKLHQNLSTWESENACDLSTLSPGSSVSNPDLTPSAIALSD